ncbi:alanine racemase [Oecophyllibacter saccharovorans]|uniref:alanine racemase n=1 Tax=Oecophyllibacter saccharovorans TaxID=2558360 RepID=UPI0011443D4C|nr:alanine racemase [Oecophyllibacter saccharovorans]QDH14522.1 alanine racemase [Oecophyllibacter saccharovorans]
MPGGQEGQRCARLTIDLGAIKRNHRRLSAAAAPAACGVVLKANAYGLGLREVARSLQDQAACFFVAHPREGQALRAVLPQADIFVLHGCTRAEAPVMARHGLVPVLNTLQQVREWQAFCQTAGERFKAAIQYDTGMTRFGLQPAQLQENVLKELNLVLQMSHLACADVPAHPGNRRQRELFVAMAQNFPGVRRSLSATSGIFLGKDYLFELVRPGAGLYGLAPNAETTQVLEPVLSLEAPVLQVLDTVPGTQAGYGLEWEAQKPGRLATVGIGYADGFFRSLAGQGRLWHGTTPLPIAGRVSMDSVMVDITSLPAGALHEGSWVSVLGPQQDPDALGAAAGTSGYEVLTSLGTRFTRHYIQS